MKKFLALILMIAVCALWVIPAYAVISASMLPAQEWNFRVFLDENEIGYHNFSLYEEEGQQTLVTEAEFKVKFLFITAYNYEHVNQETWAGNCLQEIRSRTDANGEMFIVRGSRDANIFELDVPKGRTEVPGCVKTFAYWNPDILNEPELLNSQTGELLQVEVIKVADETLTVKGQDTSAERYRLTARNLKLDIWYSKDDRWLALESTVKGGRILRYELT
jgi:hypothetical protein